MKKQLSTDWFVEPCDAHTNEVIAKNLSAVNKLNEHLELDDEDGLPHSVYQVENYAFITRLYKDKQKFALRFNVYSRQGRNRPLRSWKFEENNKKKKNNLKKK